ncbi:DUF2309 domain-containing protein [Subtercola boreus]|uniref:Probable inorganic carbon transporter subunit DabA n=1 Tax=Subtercola boreus TaxID=120213 RepID=A0A3E0WDL2_9MICO|nr:DUF2309 domain-containing protein [Subtercola boreus]RFA23237.1 hypothetical protein B7R24_02315 [Subtercola boreus]RFA23310.1 hypothetical protein B7R23_02305 [Subtercola boreus]RFA29113.1 hypothetical protein B7R25_02320 [Subtercola boreus]
MSLILRAHVAAAAHDIVPSWPLDSFIAVNPLAGAESRPFGSGADPDVAITRSTADFVTDFHRGRIPVEALERALVARIPTLAQTVPLGEKTLPAATIAALDMIEWPDSEAGTVPAEDTALDRSLCIWIAAYLNPDPLWAMPHRDQGFYAAWRRLAAGDLALPRPSRRRIADAPEDADAALQKAVSAVAPSELHNYLRAQLAPLPGWVAHIKWRAEKVGDIDLTNYLAVRLTLGTTLESNLVTPVTAVPAPVDTTWERAGRIAVSVTRGAAGPEVVAAVARVLAEHPPAEHLLTWQAAYEEVYRTELVGMLRSIAEPTERPDVQVVLCIDPRSEGLRRHLERYRGVETLGFAGFFGVPIRFSRYAAQGAMNALPALLTPRHRVTEHPLDTRAAARTVAAARRRGAFGHALRTADAATLSPFAFAETAGWFSGALTALRTLAPSTHARLERALSSRPGDLPARLTTDGSFTLDERVSMAATAMRVMGLTRPAPLVVLTGHGSHSTNNLYQSALDCGACGGNPGGVNARAAAELFNDPEVRAALAGNGLRIPDDTVFVAAEHDTVRDTVTVLDRHSIPQSHLKQVREFEELQAEAGTRLVTERARTLPGARSRRAVERVRQRADDWAEVYPELGLAGNAAMIIGPRELTRGVDLSRRVFLHSYRTELDPDGSALETIMTAPLIVAQWINHQYYFSTLNPGTLGAGTKTIHNAVGTLGVLAGHRGDLRRGLPWQSVGFGSELLHEPMRLTVVIEAALDRIGQIISANQVLRNLLDNEWITLTARDNIHHPWHRYTRYGWTPTITLTARQNQETPV